MRGLHIWLARDVDRRACALSLHRGEINGAYLFANVPDDLSLLASGVTPAREAEAGGMTEVPKA